MLWYKFDDMVEATPTISIVPVKTRTTAVRRLVCRAPRQRGRRLVAPEPESHEWSPAVVRASGPGLGKRWTAHGHVTDESSDSDSSSDDEDRNGKHAASGVSVSAESDPPQWPVVGRDGSLSASSAPLPSLSPSRPRLFPDDSDDEDELEPVTPSSAAGLSSPPSKETSPWSPPSLPLSSWSFKRAVDLRPVSNDPLLSPAPCPPVLARSPVGSTGWLPAATAPTWPGARRSSTSMPSPPTVVSASEDAPRAMASPKAPKVSLLTASLRSLARLPNLSLTNSSSNTAPEPVPDLDLEGLGSVDTEWHSVKSAASSGTGAAGRPLSTPPSPSRHALVIDHEHVTAVRLKTFSVPSPGTPACHPVETPELAPLETTAEAPARPPSSSPSPSPPPPRFISNQRHLLMLSLEISMMQAHKIRSPLRPRAVVVRFGGPPGGSAVESSSPSSFVRADSKDGHGHATSSCVPVAGSALRWEVMA